MPNFNDSMHRRNIFRKKPDFKAMALECPELKSFISIGARGKPKFDFKNSDALRALTCTLMKKYFHKNIFLPEDRLIPAVPQRLNYVCWVEDLVSLLQLPLGEQVIGLDIGTGASCVFPILACHRNLSWSMLATESDHKSYEYAKMNIDKNYLGDNIRVELTESTSSLSDMISLSPKRPVHFTMCNPPFFGEEFDISQGTKDRAKSQSNTSSVDEAVTAGGEEMFVGSILDESLSHREDIIIYTTMLGRKSSLLGFKKRLREDLSDQVSSWTWAEFCQGRTIRYGLAWTFCPSLDLSKAPPLRHLREVSWSFKLPDCMHEFKTNCASIMRIASNHLMHLVRSELRITKHTILKNNKHVFEVKLKANENTWINQRRRRREAARNRFSASGATNQQQRQQQQPTESQFEIIDVNESPAVESGRQEIMTDNILEDYEVIPLPSTTQNKRKAPSLCNDDLPRVPNNEFSSSIDNDRDESPSNKKSRFGEVEESDEESSYSKYLVVCQVSLVKQDDAIQLILRLDKQFSNNQTAYELFQFFKNRFKDPFW